MQLLASYSHSHGCTCDESSTSRLAGLHYEPLPASIVIHDYKQLAMSTSENGVIGAFGTNPVPRYILILVFLIYSMFFESSSTTCSLHKHIYVVTNLLLFI